MSLDWDNKGGFSCGGAVTTSKKLKKGDVSIDKQENERSSPSISKSMLFIPPSRRPKATQRLRPEKWRAAFDLEGRPVGFHKLLKIIRKGGVDHSIRAEVWEFLLGCYELGTTFAYRERVRQARRERYNELLQQCRTMHSSIGTGSLAYTVGSKLMDVRVTSNGSGKDEDVPLEDAFPVDDSKDQSKAPHQSLGENRRSNLGSFSEGCAPGAGTENLNSIVQESCRGEKTEAGLPIQMEQKGVSTFDDLRLQEPLPGEVHASKHRLGAGLVQILTPIDVDQKSVEIVGLGHKSGNIDKDDQENSQNSIPSHLVESISYVSIASDVECTLRKMEVEGQREEMTNLSSEQDEGNSTFMKSVDLDTVPGPRLSGGSERATNWLWTLHRIVVDVVRTDRHLEFYNEGKNSARLSDILAVYAWVDPDTGYCQGMSDLLSPFIVLFDIDADAFWCFESLLKRMRDNFQMEGPLRVMKQLEAMSNILEVTDADMLKHLVLVGADNFLFAFRMLLVLFRRELSIAEALYMWEMMWAADFHQATAWAFEHHSLEALRLPNFNSPAKIYPLQEDESCRDSCPDNVTPPTSPEGLHMASSVSPCFDSVRLRTITKRRSFCGLRPGKLWQMNRNRLNSTNIGLSGPDGDQDISVFCVAAIMEQNRGMLMEKLQSMDDAIKIFNNMDMEFKVHSCVNTAVKLRKRYRNQSSKHVTWERRSISRQSRSV